MDTTWVSLAKGRDPTRSNLCRVYVEPSRMWATDGHRAHILPTSAASKTAQERLVATPIKLETWEAASPIDQVIPKETGVLCNGADLLALVQEAIRGYYLPQSPVKNRTRIISVVLTPRSGELFVAGVHSGSLKLDAAGKPPRNPKNRCWDPDSAPFTLGVVKGAFEPLHSAVDHVKFNAKYLRDALGKAPKIVYYWNDDPLNPLKLTHEDGRIAVVMPLRKSPRRF